MLFNVLILAVCVRVFPFLHERWCYTNYVVWDRRS